MKDAHREAFGVCVSHGSEGLVIYLYSVTGPERGNRKGITRKGTERRPKKGPKK